MSDPLVRHWDPEKKFEGAVLKVYTYWCLEVSWKQHTLGSFIFFCRREGIRLLSQTTDAEGAELRIAMEDVECALRRHELFRADHFNYMQMGNMLPLLHLHGIPRYKGPRNFMDQEWTDVAWGDVPQWSRQRVYRDIVEGLVEQLQPLLPK